MRKVHGFLFVLPWLIGFLVFFLIPIINNIIFSFNIVGVADAGGRELTFNGLKNYFDLFKVELASDNETQILQMFVEEVITILTNTPLITIFSLFAAMLINMKYKGQGVVRVIFFLPIILGLDIVISLLSASSGGAYIDSQTQNSTFLQAELAKDLLMNSGLPMGLVNFVYSSVSQIFQVIARSGVQILIYLAGLQSINKSLYEVAEIEGANKYEVFWKITLPMVSTQMLFVVIYTIVDMFFASKLTYEIYTFSFTKSKIGIGAALSSVYLLFVILLISLVWFIFSKVVHRND